MDEKDMINQPNEVTMQLKQENIPRHKRLAASQKGAEDGVHIKQRMKAHQGGWGG